MDAAVIVKVAVSAVPYAVDRPFDYLVPDALLSGAVPGVRVTVPFGKGNREREGMILSRTDGEKRQGLKPLLTLLDSVPVLEEGDIALALWMCRRYFCTFYEALRTILPMELWYQVREMWYLAEPAAETLAAFEKRERTGEILAFLRARKGKADWKALHSAFGEIRESLCAMERGGVLRREARTKLRRGAQTRRMAELAIPAADAAALAERGRSGIRREVVRFLSTAGRASCADVCYYTGASSDILRDMKKKGILVISEEAREASLWGSEPGDQERRKPGAAEQGGGEPEAETYPEEARPVLNGEQAAACESIGQLMEARKPSAVLLYGVTGSGKTQVYLDLVEKALHAGRSAMVLVPEIILTPQMMRRFSARFGTECAMLHSSLRIAERYVQWQRVKRGEARVVLGARSAVFAPVRNLGVVILDEEQESSYQSDSIPRYHTRDIAKYLCARDGAALVLGSATPTVETAWQAEQGLCRRVVLQKRYNEKSLPEVSIADLREDVRAGYPGMIGAVLRREIGENLRRGEQSILFLNRRGSSRMLLCGECGYVPECPRCSVPMTYHSANGRLMCHYCGHSERSRETCPSCGGKMKHIGGGTQKAEEELRKLFPDTGILRMDADTASGRHEEVLSRFEAERIPILLGTQMVAKGLDFENVTLVGALLADMSLYVDHYRAAERTFSLLTQVVGRAGRGEKRGRAVIQTYTPGNGVILSAAAQDYDRFYREEIRLRRLRRYPPFADLFTLTAWGLEESAVLHAAVRVRDTLRGLCGRPEMARTEPEVLGPAPAPVLKVNNQFRYRVLLAGRNDRSTRDLLSWLLKAFALDRNNRGVHLSIDCNAAD